MEREAVHRAISPAEIAGVPLTIVHVSNGEALDEIRRARRRGARVFAETCPQYVTLTARDLDRSGLEGTTYVCSPPPRDAPEHAAIWGGIERGDFELSPSTTARSSSQTRRARTRPARASFRHIPNGIPGVETRLPILFSEGVSKGRISLARFAELTATNHARLYGLAPRKGSVTVGADADLALWDPALARTIRQADLHHGSDYTPWEGFEVTGWPVATYLRGRAIMREGRLADGPAGGRYLPRDPPRVVA